MTRIEKIRIHPAIGVARVGNHPNEFFIGPEKPHFVNPEPPGGYKAGDGGGRKIKRQAARFRLYGYDRDNRLVREITNAEAKISWTVHLANKKASWHRFKALQTNTPLRNQNTPESERGTLNIDPGPRTLSDTGKIEKFDTGNFTEWNSGPRTVEDIYLGEIRTDSAGRLLVLGGLGKAASPWSTELSGSFNNDGWYDDTSDGPVDATVILDGVDIPVEGAWVICGPPNYAPAIGNLVSIYDRLHQRYRDNGQYQGFIDSGLMLPVRAKPSWRFDVYPLLKRIYNVSFVMDIPKHQTAIRSDILDPSYPRVLRVSLMGFVRNPESGGGGMPLLLGDEPGDRTKPLTFTMTQYEDILRQWVAMDVELGGIHGTPPSDESIEISPQGLDRAALENCVGGGLHPGIEAGWFLRDDCQFFEPFRLARDPVGDPPLEAGDVTKQMAVPWQTDMFSCDKQPGGWGFWPGIRPDDVIPEGSEVDFDAPRERWVRDWVGDEPEDRVDMVRHWDRLGFVVEVSPPGEPPVSAEVQRDDPD